MSFLINVPVNLWRLLRNAYVRLRRRAPNYVWIEVGGALPEFESRMGLLRRRLRPGSTGPSLEGIREILGRVRADDRPEGVILRIRGLDAGWAALEELRRELVDFRGGGKKVLAYIIEADSRAYYLACVADEILAAPLATLNVVGVRTRINFFKDALNRAGLEAEVVAVSPYKSAYDPLARSDFSEEAREQAQRLLERRHAELVAAIAEGRDLSPEEARARIDRAPYGAREALSEGLLDGVCYEDELAARLGEDGKRAELAEWGAARGALLAPYRRGLRRRVGVVSLSGAIVRGKSRKLPLPLPLIGGEQAGDESVAAALRAAEKDRRVAAVLFHVESGGGDALASDLIWREVERIRGKKPVVVLMGNLAASGGYYVGSAASHVVARRNTITGSIGVLALRPVARGLYGRLGVNPVALERGARAGIMDASRRPTPDEMEVLEGQIRYLYDEFLDRVLRGRKMERVDLEEIAGGRVWTGAEALERGLADEVGGFREALRRARELGQIKEDGTDVLLRIMPPRQGRPAPGDPAEVVGEVRGAASELLETRLWARLPYDLTEY